MIGIRIPINFLSPYRSKSIIEFWRNWHISLSKFLKYHLYIPLGGGYGSSLAKYRNIMVTMILGGIWHGAGWGFIIWGFCHGFLLVLNHMWRRIKRNIMVRSSGIKWFCGLKVAQWCIARLNVVLVFSIVTVLWVFFRGEDIQNITFMILSMFGTEGGSSILGIYRRDPYPLR